MKMLQIVTPQDVQALNKNKNTIVFNNQNDNFNNWKTVDLIKVTNTGYQNENEVNVIIDNTYSMEWYKKLKEKNGQKPLLHTKQFRNLRKRELNPVIIKAFMNNQDAPYVRTKGSMICELYHSYLESFCQSKGLKSAPICYTTGIGQSNKWNLHQMRNYTSGKYDDDGKLSEQDLKDFTNIINMATHTRYYQIQYYNNGYYYHVDNTSSKWVVERANEWINECQLLPDKPYWDHHCYNELIYFVRKRQNILSYKDAALVRRYFYNLWKFSYIVSKAQRCGIAVVLKPSAQSALTNDAAKENDSKNDYSDSDDSEDLYSDSHNLTNGNIESNKDSRRKNVVSQPDEAIKQSDDGDSDTDME